MGFLLFSQCRRGWGFECVPVAEFSFATLFGTVKSQQVAMGVVNGEDTLEIATKHFVSEETVRKQLKAVRKKTQTSNRIELIRKLMDAGHHSFSFSSQSH